MNRKGARIMFSAASHQCRSIFFPAEHVHGCSASISLIPTTKDDNIDCNRRWCASSDHTAMAVVYAKPEHWLRWKLCHQTWSKKVASRDSVPAAADVKHPFNRACARRMRVICVGIILLRIGWQARGAGTNSGVKVYSTDFSPASSYASEIAVGANW